MNSRRDKQRLEKLWRQKGEAGGVDEEEVDDRINSLLRAGSNITLTYDDTANTLTISSTGGGGGGSGNSYFPGGW